MITATEGAKSVPVAMLQYLANIIHSYVIDTTHKSDDPLTITYALPWLFSVLEERLHSCHFLVSKSKMAHKTL